MVRLASKNTAQNVREEKVRIAFADMMAMLLRHAAGGDCLSDAPIRDFLAVYDAMRAESEDPKGMAVHQPDLTERPDSDDNAINMLLRGALRQVAALYENPRMGADKTEAYEAGRDELWNGLMALNRKIGMPSMNDLKAAIKLVADWCGSPKRPTKVELTNLLFLIGGNMRRAVRTVRAKERASG